MIISQLFIYPLKSAAGISIDDMPLDALGPKDDRRWMLVDDNGRFISQRTHPRLCQLNTALSANGLTLSTNDGLALEAPRGGGSEMAVTVWRDQILAQDCGEVPARELSAWLNKACRLVYMPDDCLRQVDIDYAAPGRRVGFADGFPLLLISEASLEAFNRHLPTGIEMKRFRPNLVVKGCEPYAEDSWSGVRAGDLQLDIVKPCSRCIIPAVNPVTTEKEQAVIDALNRYRRRGTATYFGQNVLHSGVGQLHVGQSITAMIAGEAAE